MSVNSFRQVPNVRYSTHPIHTHVTHTSYFSVLYHFPRCFFNFSQIFFGYTPSVPTSFASTHEWNSKGDTSLTAQKCFPKCFPKCLSKILHTSSLSLSLSHTHTHTHTHTHIHTHTTHTDTCLLCITL